VVGFSDIDFDDPEDDIPPSPAHAMLWQDTNGNGRSDEGEMLDLGRMEGSADYEPAYARAINNSGQVVGCAGDRGFLINPLLSTEDGTPQAWYMDDGQGFNALMIDLGPVSSGSGIDINDAGEIVGTAGNFAFLLRPAAVEILLELGSVPDVDADGINDLMILLPPSGGATSSSATAINANGLIAGRSAETVVLWQVESVGGITEFNLGKVNGYEKAGPYDLNSYGQVVGDAYSWIGAVNALTGGKPKWEACLSEDGRWVKLADRIVDWGTLADGMSRAFGINAHRQIVGDAALVPKGWPQHAFIAVPVP
jgi:uncharacterized membrane protein